MYGHVTGRVNRPPSVNLGQQTSKKNGRSQRRPLYGRRRCTGMYSHIMDGQSLSTVRPVSRKKSGTVRRHRRVCDLKSTPPPSLMVVLLWSTFPKALPRHAYLEGIFSSSHRLAERPKKARFPSPNVRVQ